MGLGAGDWPRAIAVGMGATVVMDLWNLFLKRAFGVRSLDYCLLGRWVLHMPGGTLRHASIAAAPRKPLECVVGRIAHYAIGLVFGVAFVALAPSGWLERPSLAPPLIFGVATVVFPFFLMQPALGLGIAASKTPSPLRARLKSLASHLAFGGGLYLSALAMRDVLQTR